MNAMWAFALAAAVGDGQPASGAVMNRVTIAEPVRFAVSVGRSVDFRGAGSVSEIFAAVERALDQQLAAEGLLLDLDRVEDCMAERRSADPVACEALVALDERARDPTLRYLLWVTGSGDGVRLGLLDLERFAERSGSDPGRAALEGTRFGPAHPVGAAGLPEVLDRRLLDDFPELVAHRLGPPVHITVHPPDAMVVVRPGVTGAQGGLEIRGRPGDACIIRVVAPDYRADERQVFVARTPTRVRVALQPDHSGWTDTRLIGASLGLAGVGLAVWGVHEASARVGPNGRDLGLIRIVPPGGPPEWTDSPGDGPLVGGVALGLGAAGLTLLWASLRDEADRGGDWPMWLMALGAGALMYGATEAANATFLELR